MEEMSEYIEICTTVQAVIFRNENNGYAVLRLVNSDDGEEITATGILPDINPGEELELLGSWTTHASYGEQFSVVSYERRLPATENGIYNYLSSNAIKGIGKKTARLIVAKFGTETFNIISEQPEKLAEIRGISLKKAYEMSAEFNNKAALRRLVEMFLKYGIPAQTAPGIYSVYGAEAEKIIAENPYVLCDERWNIDFSCADKMAFDFNIEHEADVRLRAGIIYELVFNLQNGHSFIPSAKLLCASASLLDVEEQRLVAPLEQLEADNCVIIESICDENAVYLTEVYNDEVFIARSVNSRLGISGRNEILSAHQLQNFLDSQEISYSDEQRTAIMLAARENMLVITGGPGTGKTTTLRGILNLFERCGVETLLAAPTGRAAKRMSELCGGQAKTIHRLLEAVYSPGEGRTKFCKNEENTINADAVIIDEASMLDIRIGASLMRALKPGTRIIFVGDRDQLPPIGPGSMLNDLLCVGEVPSVRLNKIFRQASMSDIITNAHKINTGEVPDLSLNKNDFYFIRRSKSEDIVSTVVKLVDERIPQSFGIDKSDIQVISPWRRREAGTVALNRALADKLNPAAEGKSEYRAAGALFREGDRVMQIKNNYDLVWEKDGGAYSGTGVFNGDIGHILCIETASEQIVVQYDDRLVCYPFSSANELELAYAVTVHKAQGSEFDAVVFAAAANGGQRLLTRSILYTAVTRAKKLLVIVGREDTVEKMVNNNRQDRRYSALFARIGT